MATDSSVGTPVSDSPLDSSTTAAVALEKSKEIQSRHQRSLRRLKREARDLKSLSAVLLLAEDVKSCWEDSTTLLKDYIKHSDVLEELTESVVPYQAEAVAETIKDDISELKRIERALSRLRHIREGYNGSLGMKRLVKQLSEIDVLIGPGCQVDIVSLRNYVKGFGPNILPLACPELQDLHDTICLEATAVLKRSEQQLIAAKATAPVMHPKPTPVPTPRSSTLSLKLPSFHGNLLKWRDFWALFCSRLEKEPGLTDVDKGYLLVEAMAGIKARQRAEAALAHTDTFDKAVLALKRHYEDDSLLFIHHFDELTQQDIIKETVEDIDRLEDWLRSSIRGMSMANGYSADQKVVAIAEKTLTPGTVKQLKQYIYEETVPPSTELFFSFLDRQRKSAPN